MRSELYLDLEWRMGNNIFLVGALHVNNATHNNYNLHDIVQLYDDTLTRYNVQSLLLAADTIYVYGPDIGVLEAHYGFDLKHSFNCINLLKAMRHLLPHLPSHKLADVEHAFGIERSTRQYKTNIWQLLYYWDHYPNKKRSILKYNAEDVLNLYRLWHIIRNIYGITTPDELQWQLQPPK